MDPRVVQTQIVACRKLAAATGRRCAPLANYIRECRRTNGVKAYASTLMFLSVAAVLNQALLACLWTRAPNIIMHDAPRAH